MAKSKRPPTDEDFQRWVRKLGRLVVAAVTEGVPRKGRKPVGWSSAFADARWTSDSASPMRIAKVRVTLDTGKPFGGLRLSPEMAGVIDRLWGMRAALFPEPWWGLKLTVFPDAPLTLHLDRNPECVLDPLWFKS